MQQLSGKDRMFWTRKQVKLELSQKMIKYFCNTQVWQSMQGHSNLQTVYQVLLSKINLVLLTYISLINWKSSFLNVNLVIFILMNTSMTIQVVSWEQCDYIKTVLWCCYIELLRCKAHWILHWNGMAVHNWPVNTDLICFISYNVLM